MFIQTALILSLLMQFAAFFLCLSLIRRTKFSISWIVISVGFFLMASRRLIELIEFIDTTERSNHDIISGWIAVVISIAMLIASVYIRKIFMEQDKMNKLREENEARILSAVIETEEKERTYFSKELHDGLAPVLSSIKMALSAIECNDMNPRNTEIIEKSEKSIDLAIESVQEISNRLSPKILQRFGIEKSVRMIADSLNPHQKMHFSIHFDTHDIRLPMKTELALYRIICELINNTVQHSEATEISISLIHRIKLIELRYNDNGIGFQPESAKGKGMGLDNIDSRARSIDAQSNIFSKPGKGFMYQLQFSYV
ncbi:MAG: sensor histidine kinase [Bacteroidales bacterium]|nr:sensor histidine kinase [Bacteroidales bacterium]